MFENESQITSDLQLAINELEKVLHSKIEIEENLKLSINENYKLNNIADNLKSENDRKDYKINKYINDININNTNISNLEIKQKELLDLNEELSQRIITHQNSNIELNK